MKKRVGWAVPKGNPKKIQESYESKNCELEGKEDEKQEILKRIRNT